MAMTTAPHGILEDGTWTYHDEMERRAPAGGPSPGELPAIAPYAAVDPAACLFASEHLDPTSEQGRRARMFETGQAGGFNRASAVALLLLLSRGR